MYINRLNLWHFSVPPSSDQKSLTLLKRQRTKIPSSSFTLKSFQTCDTSSVESRKKKAELDQNIHALFQYNQSMLWGGQAPKSWKEKHLKKRPSLTVWCSWIFCFKKVMQVWNDMRETKWGHFWFAFNMPDYNAIVRVMCYENAWETHLTPSSFWHLEVELLPEESQRFLSERISQNWSKTAHISAQSQTFYNG